VLGYAFTFVTLLLLCCVVLPSSGKASVLATEEGTPSACSSSP